MRPSVSRVGRNNWETGGDKWDTSVRASGQEYLSRETSKETSRDKCKNIRPIVFRVGRDKPETSATSVKNKSLQPRVPNHETKRQLETSVTSGQVCLEVRDKWGTSGDKCNKKGEASGQECLSRETSKEASGDKCHNIRPSVSRVGRDKWETSGDKCSKGNTQGDKWETSVKSCGPEHPVCTGRQGRQVELQHHASKATTAPQERKPGDKHKIMRPGHATLSNEQEPLTGKPVRGKKQTPDLLSDLFRIGRRDLASEAVSLVTDPPLGSQGRSLRRSGPTCS